MSIDTVNRFAVAAGGSGVVVLMPPLRGQVITPDEALLFAAWLVAIAEVDASHSFSQVLEAVIGT